MITTKFFVERCKSVFNFLISEYDFEITDVVQKDLWGDMIFRKKDFPIAISVYFERHERYLCVYFNKIVNGKLPDPLKGQKDIVNLHRLVPDEASPLHIQKTLKEEFTEEDLDKVLISHASALRQYGSNILAGDFAIFEKS